MKNSSKKTIIVLFNSIVMAFVFVLLFSYSTSPIYAKWIMAADGHQKTIQNVLDNRYNCVKSVMEGEQKYLLYHLQD